MALNFFNCRRMAQFQNHYYEDMVDEYYDIANFDDNPFDSIESKSNSVDDSFDSDFEDDVDQVCSVVLNILNRLYKIFILAVVALIKLQERETIH